MLLIEVFILGITVHVHVYRINFNYFLTLSKLFEVFFPTIYY